MCQLALSTEVVNKVHLALLTIHGRLDKRRQLQLQAGTLRVQSHRFSCKGTPKWGLALRSLALTYKEHHNQPLATFAATHNNLSLGALEVLFSCPAGHCRQATQQVFSITTPSKAVWCSFCKKSWGGRKWICSCSKSWAKCPLHYNCVPVGQLKRKNKPSPIPSPAAPDSSNCKRQRIDIHNMQDGLLHFQP
eukprot:7941621-Karenia_brevis.AAC.1